jgi:hypothetical protein
MVAREFVVSTAEVLHERVAGHFHRTAPAMASRGKR